MDADPGPGILWIIIAICILLLVLAGLLTAAGNAVTAVNRNAIRRLADTGQSNAKKLVVIFEHPQKHLNAAAQLIGFAAVAMGVMVSYAVSDRLSSFLAEVGLPVSRLFSLLILSLITTLIYMVFARIYPKQIALRHPEGTALALAGYLQGFSAFLKPFLAVSNGLTNFVLAVTRQEPGIKEGEFSEEDVMSMLEAGQESGAIKEEGKKMIDSIFAFDDILAHEIMTPRTDVFMIDVNAPFEEYGDDLMEMRYSRIPVYDDDTDNIIGILNIKDYMIKAWEYGFDDVHIDKILREPFFVPDTKNIDALFMDLQRQKQHIAILIDEYGGFTGIVTMEDIIEEVMGDIDDEFDEEEPEIEKVDDENYWIDGSMYLDDVNEETGAELISENSETVGGLLIDIMGEIPEDDDDCSRIVEYGNYTFTIKSVKDKRIERVLMHIAPISHADGETENSGNEDKGR